MEIGLIIDNITDKEAGDIIQQIVLDLQEQGYLVTDYFVEVQ